VDGTKKELLGPLQQHWRDWQAQGVDTVVTVDDLLSLADGTAIPDGVYDRVHHRGFVTVGRDQDTAACAVASIQRWWYEVGQALDAGQQHLLITADGGGCNGVRNRRWKPQLQAVATAARLTITVAH
jgi:hypothetical protein